MIYTTKRIRTLFSKTGVFSLLILVFALSSLFPQKTMHYYQVDKVITVQGEVTRIAKERCFANDEFVVLYIKEEGTDTLYRAEISPGWFFNLPIGTGNAIKITGSVYIDNNTRVIITRSLFYQGQWYYFRDELGFPLWRGKGGGMKRRGRS